VDQSTLVEVPIDDGRRFVERFAADGNPVEAAFWVKATEEEFWFLYVATDLYDCVGPAAAYRAVNASLRKLGTSSLSGSEIKLIGTKNPIAKDVLAIMRRRPIPVATGSATLGGMAVDKMLLYPPRLFTFSQPNPMTTEEIGEEIVRLMNRGPGLVLPSCVTLKDGSQFNGVPFSLEVGPQSALEARFNADGEAAPRVVRLDEIAAIS
jgi:hypothetical protein